MKTWAGKPIITYKELPKTGDRSDFQLTITGPGETEYTTKLSITRTLSSIWNIPPSQAVIPLAETIFKVTGTAKAPPPKGFWFDSYNSEDSLKETKNKILNKSIKPFVLDWEDLYTSLIGTKAFTTIQDINRISNQKNKKSIFKNLDDIGELSQIIEDLNFPPTNNAEYLYRVCLLAGILDHMRAPIEQEKVACETCGSGKGTLFYFYSWLEDILEKKDYEKINNTLQNIKNLRKQYPIHDHYNNKKHTRTVRTEVTRANEYFDIKQQKPYEENWNKVLETFSTDLQLILKAIT